MKINIDLGNVWEALSAIGTIGAVIVSLVLAYRKGKKDIKITAGYDQLFNNRVAIIVSKSPLEQVTIIDFGYIKLKKVSLKSESYFISEDGVHQIADTLPFNFHLQLRIYFTFFNSLKIKQGDKIRYYIKDIEGNIYKSPKFLFYNNEYKN
ncbi:hypothetical protein RZO31_13500 [Lactococcus lactis]|uniref:Uncharacterized protein n=1 Tax=Lactococcus lactis TaxID=1358 RepID=A0AAE4T2J2_9LACT|nr:hypothetical protein [Lactococcus lactis]MDV2633862.1 hypothetical protein [Lactococcus lactis]